MSKKQKTSFPSKAPAIEVHDLSVSYAHKPVLWSVECDFAWGEITAIVGPNGAGKSTLLKSILGFVPVSGGYVKIDGKNFSKMTQSVAYVPQREEVDWDFPITVEEVVMMARYSKLKFYQLPRAKDKELVEKALKKVSMYSLRKRQIRDLSGGQQQRVFLARALAQEAKIYLLDEPFSGIDATTEKAMLEVFKELSSEGASLVCVHHDLNTVQEYFDSALLLNVRNIAFGNASEVLSQENILKAYSGKPQLLADVSERLRERNYKKRDVLTSLDSD